MIAGKQVFFRAFEPNDYVLLNEWHNCPEIQKLTSGTFRYVSSEREKEWVLSKIKNDSENIYWAICMNDESKKMIGYTSINQIDLIHRKAFHGGVVIGDKNYRDGQIMIDTFLDTFSYAFDELNLNRLEAKCLVEHQTSYKMLKIMGYSLEGIKRQAIYKHGKYHDQYLFSILKSEYSSMLTSNEFAIDSILKRLKQENKKK
ncbi:MAG: GNAT family protein [Dysgonamonadaceae bacterium]|nr:GNAT family protein [Dysgonamonadaceae bacterium]MDD4760730.1 GNAT family protein [Bacteroidaceae bacterium]